MPVYHAFGTAWVSTEELMEKTSTGAIKKFTRALKTSPSKARLEFSSGLATKSNLMTKLSVTGAKPIPYAPIGPGKPLTIMIRHVYTGKYPEPGFFGGDSAKDMLVTSAMKGVDTYDEAPRAVNFLKNKVKAHSHHKTAAATEKGTPLIYYTPALTKNSTTLTLEIILDTFNQQIFESVGSAMSSAAGIPIFASASAYLLAGGMVVNLLGKLGESLFDGDTIFQQNDTISFFIPGLPPAKAELQLMTMNDFPQEVLEEYQPAPDGRLVKTSNPKQAYSGDHPYVVFSLDGHPNDEYKDFTPTAASAALLERFYNTKDKDEQRLGYLLDAFKLYNDWEYRKKADEAAKALAGLKKGSADYKAQKTKLDAFIKNITNEALRPK